MTDDTITVICMAVAGLAAFALGVSLTWYRGYSYQRRRQMRAAFTAAQKLEILASSIGDTHVSEALWLSHRLLECMAVTDAPGIYDTVIRLSDIHVTAEQAAAMGPRLGGSRHGPAFRATPAEPVTPAEISRAPNVRRLDIQ